MLSKAWVLETRIKLRSKEERLNDSVNRARSTTKENTLFLDRYSSKLRTKMPMIASNKIQRIQRLGLQNSLVRDLSMLVALIEKL
jgi:hypothetical protein